MLRHFFAITLDLLLDSLLEVVVGGADHHSLTLEACKQTHLPLLARGREVGLESGERSSITMRFTIFDFAVGRVVSTGIAPVLQKTTYMIQDIVSLLAGSNLDELAQEQWRSLGDGGQFGNVLRLAL